MPSRRGRSRIARQVDGESRAPGSDEDVEQQGVPLRRRARQVECCPPPPPLYKSRHRRRPPCAAAAAARLRQKIVSGHFNEENLFVLISSVLLVQADEGASFLVMDRIGDIYRNLPRRADVIVTMVGARHKCQQELENRKFDSAAGPPPCAAAPLSQAHERARWRDCRAMCGRWLLLWRDVVRWRLPDGALVLRRSLSCRWARRCALAMRWPLGVASLVARKGGNSCLHCAPLLDDHGAPLLHTFRPMSSEFARNLLRGRAPAYALAAREISLVAEPPAGRRSGESPAMS
ncbi:hypothetical protein F511_16758 [Dorcoceras hygrometricum]|uniref:Uncharacterized protein n=1 Tax=Dorcoceras hygrometricum TaxID=472368 RepID=A0A2Z7CRF1_9LAMI|nr:hypothetical protein F511_16758 [Dorcoceras hygrometricum]